MKEDLKELLIGVLLKKAKGCLLKEKTDEYAVIEGKKKLVKSKVVTKRASPDVGAVKALLQLDEGGLDYADMSDEQLKEEKNRLLKLLAESESDPPNAAGD